MQNTVMERRPTPPVDHVSRVGSWFKNAVLLLVSFAIAVSAAELCVRLFVPVRDLGAQFTVNDPIMGKRIKRQFHTVRETPEFKMAFTSNSLGFRGPEPAHPTPDAVLFLGDSFTMGYGVSDGEEFPALIRQKLKANYGESALAVVNTGMGNNGNGRWIKLLKNEADQYKPNVVVMQIMVNDYDDNIREQYFRLDQESKLIELPVKQSWAKTIEHAIDAIPGVSDSHLYGLVRQTYAVYAHKIKATSTDAPGLNDYAERLTERLVSETIALCREKGIPVYAVLIQIEGIRLERMHSLLASQNVPYLATPSPQTRPDLHYPTDGHWNAQGHRYVAEALFEQLKKVHPLHK